MPISERRDLVTPRPNPERMDAESCVVYKRPFKRVVYGATLGDEGKGNVVQWLCKNAIEADKKVCINKTFTSPYSSHTVYNNKTKYTSTYFGAGALLGVPVRLSTRGFLDPVQVKIEKQLLLAKGIRNPQIYSNAFGCFFLTPYDIAYGKFNPKGLTQRWNDGYYSSNWTENLQTALRYFEEKAIKLNISEEELNLYKSATEWCARYIRFDYDDNNYDEIIVESDEGLLLERDNGLFSHSGYQMAHNVSCQLNSKSDELYFVTRCYSTKRDVDYNFAYPIQLEDEPLQSGLLEIDLLKRSIDRHALDSLCRDTNTKFNLVVTHTDKIDDGRIKEFALTKNTKINFNTTEEALNILDKELSSYIKIDNIYYSNNPYSDIKLFK